MKDFKINSILLKDQWMLISHGTVKIKSGLKSNHFDFLFRNSVLVENESKLLSLSYENNQAYQTWI